MVRRDLETIYFEKAKSINIQLRTFAYTWQGRLKIWTEHSTLILLISIQFELAQQKFQDFYNLGQYQFSPNFKGIAQKLGPPRPFEVLDVFGGKSKFWAPMTLIF